MDVSLVVLSNTPLAHFSFFWGGGGEGGEWVVINFFLPSGWALIRGGRLFEVECLKVSRIFCHNCTHNTTCYSLSCTKRPFHRKRKISSQFSNRHQTITSFNLKTLAQLFQIAIHFHPGHPQLKTITDSLDTLI